MAEAIEAFRAASEMFRTSSFSIEDKIRAITAQMDAMNKEAAAKPEKEKEKPKPFQGHSVALDTLFIISFLLIRLLNQSGVSDITRGKLTNYFEHFKRMIDVYSYMLIIGHTIDYPPKSKKEGEEDDAGADAGSKEGKESKESKEGKGGPQTGGGADDQANASVSETVEIKDNPIFLRELKAFYSYLFMTVSSNAPLKEILQYPSNPSFKERTDWLGFLTPKEEAQLIKKESLATQDRLFQNVMDIFALLFDKFQIVADMRSGKLAEQPALVDQLNQKVNLFNSAKPETYGADPAQNALAQTELLETIMKEGPIPVPLVSLKVLGQQLADTAATVKQQLYTEATPDKEVLRRMYGSISKLLSSKAADVILSATVPITPTAPPAEPNPKADTDATPEKAVYGSVKKLVTTGGYRLRKSRKVHSTSKKRTLRRSKRYQ